MVDGPRFCEHGVSQLISLKSGLPIPVKRQRQYAAGELIILQGQSMTNAARIVSGYVMATRFALDERERAIALLGPGDSFSWDGDLCGFGLQAISPAEILWRDSPATDDSLKRGVMQRAADWHVSLSVRAARVLARLFVRFGSFSKGDCLMPVQTWAANYVGQLMIQKWLWSNTGILEIALNADLLADLAQMGRVALLNSIKVLQRQRIIAKGNAVRGVDFSYLVISDVRKLFQVAGLDKVLWLGEERHAGNGKD